ncbi:MAG: GNAT family N-acetyltransferase [Saprospiraceae bacterium]
MESIQFKKCNIDDWASLKAISVQTFRTAFDAQNTEEDMDIYVAKAFTSAQIKTELGNKNSLFYFVQIAHEIIGYLKLNVNAAQTETIPNGLEIERIYLLSAFQGKGYGQIMMYKAFEIAKDLKKTRLWLGVWEKNYGAVRFYERNGFKKFSTHDFYLGKDLQTDWLMDISIEAA